MSRQHHRVVPAVGGDVAAAQDASPTDADQVGKQGFTRVDCGSRRRRGVDICPQRPNEIVEDCSRLGAAHARGRTGRCAQPVEQLLEMGAARRPHVKDVPKHGEDLTVARRRYLLL
ncbi:ABC-F family ATP-binding cassette domain-containing protein [Babesia caballi]|uniref:ABC-F family ATP-binding cassette domain-containing protein n=1 Tax=Babesia caballi TaxID=5871 RepID=A0AAV4LUR9_BABCB|nr:ABC-F family ATP-binding cassette domain-containing protein [Babesia caballi]